MAGIDSLYGVPQRKKLTPLDMLYGAGEMLAAMGTGTLAQLGGGISYLPAYALGGNEAGQRVMQAVQDAYTYQPSGAAAQRFWPAIGEVVSPIAKSASVGAQTFANNVYNATGSPVLGAAARAAPTAIDLLADRAGIGRAWKGNHQMQISSPEYGIDHRPPSAEYGAPLHDLTQIFPDDVYGSNAAQYYGHGMPSMDRKAITIAKLVRGNPDAEVVMYRAVPKQHSSAEFNPGDWVTTTKEYAKEHGESALGGDYVIIQKKVKAKDLYTSPDSIHEYGFWPQD